MAYSKIAKQLSNSPTPRIHPLFPLPQEVKANPALAYSDHLPIFAQVPLSDNTTLNIISLNILGGIKCSGIHERGSFETTEQTIERYQRMIKGLKISIEKHNVDILAFQEAEPSLIVPLLQEKLGENWAIIEDDVKIVTCYKKDRWIEQQTASNRQHRVRSITLCRNDNNNLTIDFHNIWGIFNELPLNLENQCRTYLEQSKSSRAVIIGDTNSRIVPLDNTVRNITTGAIPLAFNEENGAKEGVQIPDYPDGGFYKDEHGKIHQLQTKILSFENGSIVEDLRTLDEITPWSAYRMVMCLDEQFHHSPVINNQTIFKYEQFLQKELANEQIVVRIASTCFNQKAIAIGLRSCKNLNPFSEYINERFANDLEFQFNRLDIISDNKHSIFNCIFVPLDKSDLLHSTIADYLFIKKHPTLAAIRDLLTIPSWKRDVLVGVSVGIPFTFILGPTAAFILGSKLSTLTVGGMALGFLGLTTGASVIFGALQRTEKPHEREENNPTSLATHKTNSHDSVNDDRPGYQQPPIHIPAPMRSPRIEEVEEAQISLGMQ